MAITATKNVVRSRRAIAAGLILLVAMFACGNWVLGTRGPALPHSIEGLWTLALRLFLVAWVRADRRIHQFSAPYEFDGFLFFAFELVFLYYSYKTRRVRGALLWLGFVCVTSLPYAVSVDFQISHSGVLGDAP